MTKAPNTKVIYINQEINKTVLFLAFELSNKKWKLGFSNGTTNRIRNVNAGDMNAVIAEIELARTKLKMDKDAQVHSCYEVGRDGFWIHRWLTHINVVNYIIDSASIEVSQKKRKAKTDKLDVGKMVRLLVRYVRGERDAFSILEVPDEEARSWDGKALGNDLMAELRREYERYKCIDDQIKLLLQEQKDRTAAAEDGALMKIKTMMQLKGIGWQSSWILVMELFGWRTFKNRRCLGSFAGLTGTPFASGDSNMEQGISKAGNKRVRHLMVELAWMWIRYQPQSDLAQWFERRFANGGKRMRRVGIVAVARKLLIGLWHFVEDGVIPKGANLKSV